MKVDVIKDIVLAIIGALIEIREALAYQLAYRGAWLSLAARDESRLKGIVISSLVGKTGLPTLLG